MVNPFSPAGNGRQSKTIFVGQVESEKLRVAKWAINIFQGDRMFKSFHGGRRLPYNLEWDGRDEQGKILPDGRYDVLLRVFNDTGLELAGTTQSLTIRTKPDPVKLVSPGTVTLTGGQQDKSVALVIPKIPHSSDWRLLIYDAANRKVFDRSGGGEAPEKISWQPRVSGHPANAGKYRVALSYRDEIGIKTVSETDFKISYAEFSVELKASPLVFKPGANNGEGVVFTPVAQGNLKMARWTLKVYAEKQEDPLRELAGEGNPPAAISWDGKDRDGKDVEGGKIYRAVFTAVAAVGTEENAESAPLQSDFGAYTGKQALTMNLVRVMFEPNSADLSEEAKKSLADAANTIHQYQNDYLIRVFGHCDISEATGKATELSRERAEKVGSYLIQQGKIPGEKIQTVGYGKDKLLTSDTASAEQARNRRVEVVLFAK